MQGPRYGESALKAPAMAAMPGQVGSHYGIEADCQASQHFDCVMLQASVAVCCHQGRPGSNCGLSPVWQVLWQTIRHLQVLSPYSDSTRAV